MNLTVIGSGYVGLVTGTCFAEMGNTVTCVDLDEQKIANLKLGILPIYEPGLEPMVLSNQAAGRLRFTTSLADAMAGSNVYFIAVGTPPDEDGSADLRHVLAVAREIGRHLNQYAVIVDKSTVPVGTAEKVAAVVQAELDRRGVAVPFDVVSNPEFLKEGDAVNDFMRPDRIVIGAASEQAGEIMRRLYADFCRNHDRVVMMGVRDAEMTKYAANAMLAARISFMNEIARVCEEVDADVAQVRRGIGSDPRIGYQFTYPGVGFGGSCFPKDLRALIATAESRNLDPRLLRAVVQVNDEQRSFFVDKIVRYYNGRGGLENKTLAVWGLAFKPKTNDVRESPAVHIVQRLEEAGATVRAFDPEALEEARRILGDRPRIHLEKDEYRVLEGADGLVLVTEWFQFRNPDFPRMKKLLKEPVIFDGRNQYNPALLKPLGFTYISIGRPPVLV